ncbi:MAG: ABC transporter ATP-binding protein [Pirellulaceae bacterium]
MPAAISVENLSKAYRIGLKDEIPDTFVGAMANVLRAPWRNFRRLRRLNTFTAHAGNSPLTTDNSSLADDTLWALRDVSFDIQEGEVVGIIGRNGAGKSTLLKILSRITEPTSGRVVIRGRVSSLLEVGTGFHPELTGRENVYMNGAILGMTKREIDRKFDEIVDFSGIERFLDTPIKRYSSGMTVRLAFSVAAHLEPEILIIDEVLAVGDAEFQKKCLGKMESVAGEGRTVLFVSHNIGAVRHLCSRGIVLVTGGADYQGEISDAIAYYLDRIANRDLKDLRTITERGGTGVVRFVSAVACAENKSTPGTLITGQEACFVFSAEPFHLGLSCVFTIYDREGVPLATFESRATPPRYPLRTSDVTFRCVIDELPLYPGSYTVNVAIYEDGTLADHVERALSFDVLPGIIRHTRVTGPSRRAKVCIAHEWVEVDPFAANEPRIQVRY